MDFLTHLSIRYTESGGKLDEEDPEETGGVEFELGQSVQSVVFLFIFTENGQSLR